MIEQLGSAAVEAVHNMELKCPELSTMHPLRQLSSLYTPESRSAVLAAMRDPHVSLKSFNQAISAAVFDMWATWHWNVESPDPDEQLIDPEIRMTLLLPVLLVLFPLQ